MGLNESMKGKPDKILYLSADIGILYWGTKGSSIHVREFVNALSQAGYDVSVLVKYGKGSSEIDNGIPLYRISSGVEGKIFDEAVEKGGNPELLREIKAFYQNGSIERQLRKLHKAKGFDTIYERYSLFDVAGLKYASKNSIPYIMEVNSPLIRETAKYRNLELIGLAEAIEKYLFNGADHIVAVSDELKKYIKSKVSTARVTVVPNGVSANHFNYCIEDDGTADEILGVAGNELIIGFVGRLRPWHGIDILIDSFAELTKDNGDIKLVIIGDEGTLKEELKRKCDKLNLNGLVRFTGSVPHAVIPSLLRKIDILVAPYPKLDEFYFSALKIFEYMAAGKPIVASQIGQINDILAHEKTAILVPPGNREALTGALQRLKNDKELRIRLGKNAQKEALSKHTWRQRINMISDIIKTVKNEKSRL